MSYVKDDLVEFHGCKCGFLGYTFPEMKPRWKHCPLEYLDTSSWCANCGRIMVLALDDYGGPRLYYSDEGHSLLYYILRNMIAEISILQDGNRLPGTRNGYYKKHLKKKADNLRNWYKRYLRLRDELNE